MLHLLLCVFLCIHHTKIFCGGSISKPRTTLPKKSSTPQETVSTLTSTLTFFMVANKADLSQNQSPEWTIYEPFALENPTPQQIHEICMLAFQDAQKMIHQNSLTPVQMTIITEINYNPLIKVQSK